MNVIRKKTSNPKRLAYLQELFRNNSEQPVGIDIETVAFNQEISVIGLSYTEGNHIKTIQLVRGINLNRESITHTLLKLRPTILVTFNGAKFDIRHIQTYFPGTIPNGFPHLDLYELFTLLEGNIDLKHLEQMYFIKRKNPQLKHRGTATKLWQQYAQTNDNAALRQLLLYNKDDSKNLLRLLPSLIRFMEMRLGIDTGRKKWIDGLIEQARRSGNAIFN